MVISKWQRLKVLPTTKNTPLVAISGFFQDPVNIPAIYSEMLS